MQRSRHTVVDGTPPARGDTRSRREPPGDQSSDEPSVRLRHALSTVQLPTVPPRAVATPANGDGADGKPAAVEQLPLLEQHLPGFGGLGVTASTPNVLGAGTRRQVTICAMVIAFLSMVGAFAALLLDKAGSQQVGILLVALAMLCMLLGYLTTMGFGAVQMSFDHQPGKDG